MKGLSHIANDGSPHMVDISGKAPSLRIATAEGTLELKSEHHAALSNLPKGDAFTMAKIAGIQAAKRCFELIPLCHQVPLTHVDVRIDVHCTSLTITAETRTEAQTGVEMEAYTAVAIAGLTLIDMLKGVDPDLTLSDVRLLKKAGGKSEWHR